MHDFQELLCVRAHTCHDTPYPCRINVIVSSANRSWPCKLNKRDGDGFSRIFFIMSVKINWQGIAHVGVDSFTVPHKIWPSEIPDAGFRWKLLMLLQYWYPRWSNINNSFKYSTWVVMTWFNCRPQMGPMLFPWSLLSGMLCYHCDGLAPSRRQPVTRTNCDSHGCACHQAAIDLTNCGLDIPEVYLLRFLDGKQLRCLQTRCRVREWRHANHYNDVRMNATCGVWNHKCLDRLLNCLFGRRLKKTSKLHITGLCDWNSPATGAQRAKTRKIFPFYDALVRHSSSNWWRRKV